jgi:hypothetical protein
MALGNVYKSIGIQILRHLPYAAQKLHDEANLKYLKEVIRHNQGRLADYYFLSNSKHKKLKDKFSEVSSSLNPSDEDLEDLGSSRNELEKYLAETFRSICKENFDFLKNLYAHKCTGTRHPRICVKAMTDDKIITMARDQYTAFDFDGFKADENTAFKYIKHTGDKYICHDIPKAVAEDRYENLRIYRDSVIKYKRPSWFRRLILRYTTDEDCIWQSCWRRTESPLTGENLLSETSSCYKSTLVIPMTFVGGGGSSALSSEFQDHFEITFNTRTNDSKLTIGFLCFDHINLHFFDENEDVDLGYIFADLLSLYMIQFLNCTNYSSVFTQTESILGTPLRSNRPRP